MVDGNIKKEQRCDDALNIDIRSRYLMKLGLPMSKATSCLILPKRKPLSVSDKDKELSWDMEVISSNKNKESEHIRRARMDSHRLNKYYKVQVTVKFKCREKKKSKLLKFLSRVLSTIVFPVTYMFNPSKDSVPRIADSNTVMGPATPFVNVNSDTVKDEVMNDEEDSVINSNNNGNSNSSDHIDILKKRASIISSSSQSSESLSSYPSPLLQIHQQQQQLQFTSSSTLKRQHRSVQFSNIADVLYIESRDELSTFNIFYKRSEFYEMVARNIREVEIERLRDLCLGIKRTKVAPQVSIPNNHKPKLKTVKSTEPTEPTNKTVNNIQVGSCYQQQQQLQQHQMHPPTTNSTQNVQSEEIAQILKRPEDFKDFVMQENYFC